MQATATAGGAEGSERGFWLAWSATLAFFAGFYALLEPLTRHMQAAGLPDGQIGLVMGLFGVAALVGRPLAGLLADGGGPRAVMLGGALALLIGAAGVPWASDLPALLGLRLLQAAGYVAFTTAGTALAVALSPPERRASRMAIFGAAANLAMVLAPAAIGALLPLIAPAAAFGLVAGLAALAGAAALLTPASRLPAGAGGPSARTARRPTFSALRSALRLLWPAMATAACLGAGFGAFFHFAPILAERRGPIPAGLLYSAYGAAIVLTRLVARGWLDRAGPARSVLAGALIFGAGLAVIAIAAGPAWLLFATALIAAGGGIFHPALISHHASLLPEAPGRASACFYIGFDLGLGLGGWLLGLALQLGGITALYLSALAIVALGAALTPLLRKP